MESEDCTTSLPRSCVEDWGGGGFPRSWPIEARWSWTETCRASVRDNISVPDKSMQHWSGFMWQCKLLVRLVTLSKFLWSTCDQSVKLSLWWKCVIKVSTPFFDESVWSKCQPLSLMKVCDQSVNPFQRLPRFLEIFSVNKSRSQTRLSSKDVPFPGTFNQHTVRQQVLTTQHAQNTNAQDFKRKFILVLCNNRYIHVTESLYSDNMR